MGDALKANLSNTNMRSLVLASELPKLALKTFEDDNLKMQIIVVE